MYTTLNEIRSHDPCHAGWKKLLASLGKTKADDEPLSIISVLDSNGLDDALWCLRAVTEHDREIRLYAVWCARQVQHLMTDPRSVAALDVAERYANGHTGIEEMDAARDAARAAARAAARDAWAAGDAASAAAWAAAGAAGDAARDAASAAAGAAGDAARDAASAAAGAAGDAARDAASAAAGAAGDAARDAASAAAWAGSLNGARDAQSKRLRLLCAAIAKAEGSADA